MVSVPRQSYSGLVTLTRFRFPSPLSHHLFFPTLPARFPIQFLRSQRQKICDAFVLALLRSAMGRCCAKKAPASGGVDASVTHPPDYRQTPLNSVNGTVKPSSVGNTPAHSSYSPWPSPYPHDVAGSPLPAGVSPSPAPSSVVTPRRFFSRPFPPPSPAKPIKEALAKRQGPPLPAKGPIPEVANDSEQPLDKSFGYGRNFGGEV